MNTKKEKEALEIAERIATLRAEILRLEAQFRQLISSSGRRRAPRQEEPAAVERKAVVRTGLAEDLRAVAAANPDRSFTVDEFAAALPAHDPKSIRGTAARLARTKNGLQSVGRGRYQYMEMPTAQRSGDTAARILRKRAGREREGGE